jgi:hypothetical protein
VVGYDCLDMTNSPVDEENRYTDENHNG